MSETAKFLTPEQAARVDHSRFDAEKIDRPTITYWQGAWRRLKKNPLAVIAMVMLAVVLFFVLLGPTISGQEYIKINASIKNTAPNSANWFGTDTMGRDIFCRVWIGARLSLIVALVCSTIQIVVGCAYGGAMAYFGGTVDSVMMRVIEVITSFPSLLITLLISGALAGFCGATKVMGVQYRFTDGFSSGYGFEGIAVAALAGNNPLTVLLSAILWGGLKSGASEVNRIASIPMDVISIIQALIVVFMVAPKLMDALCTPMRKLLAGSRRTAARAE